MGKAEAGGQSSEGGCGVSRENSGPALVRAEQLFDMNKDSRVVLDALQPDKLASSLSWVSTVV